MSREGVYLKKFDSPGESRVDLTTAQSDNGSFHKQKTCTTLVKVLVFIVFLALAAAIAACIAVVIIARKDEMTNGSKNGMQDQNPPKVKMTTTMSPTIPEDNTVCMTPECVVAAARLYEALDTTVHPCDDFYEYACGTWKKKHVIPEDRSSISTFAVLGDELSATLKGILERPSESDELPSVTKAKNYYKACVNVELIEKRGLEPMDYIWGVFGEWPLLNDTWREDTFNLEDTLITIRRFGSSPIMYYGVGTDLKNSTRRVLQLDQSGMIMPSRDFYLKNANKSIPALRQYIKSMALAFGAPDNARVDQDIEDMIQFEIAMANITVPREERRDIDAIYNIFTIKELYTNISTKFDWLKYNKGVMGLPGIELNVTEDETIIVYSPVYLKQVLDLIDASPKRTVRNYLMTSELLTWLGILPKRFGDLGKDYNKVLFGIQADSARWLRCVSSTNGIMGNAVGRVFIEEAFDEDAKDIAHDMIGNIRVAFNELLDDLDWMDEPTRKVAIEKAAAMKENIGYSEKEVKNDTYLEEEYKEHIYDSEKYFENILLNTELFVRKSFRELRKPIDKTKSQAPPAIVNAFYSPVRNDISFPAGILQPPFFSKHFPKSMNYGGIGVVIGHEITHGFDDSGRRFDKDGDLLEWWSKDIIDNFKDKAQCIVDQYGNYTVPEAEMNLNGINTQGENIADNGGLRQSFTAYRDWVKKQGKEEQKLPGIDYTPNQLFFLSFAQVWCTNMRPQSAVNRILLGAHSPGKYRVLGTLQNSKEFSEAFNCPSTSYMNPDRKCRVW